MSLQINRLKGAFLPEMVQGTEVLPKRYVRAIGPALAPRETQRVQNHEC